MSFNQSKKEEDTKNTTLEQIEDLNQEERVPEFDEIGTALNGI